jgi:hypothetical protein
MPFVITVKEVHAIVVTIAWPLFKYVSNATTYYNRNMKACTAHFSIDQFSILYFFDATYD